MLCDLCKKNVATVHLTQLIEGKTQKIDLCESCSKEKGVDDPTGFSLADLLLGLGAAQELAQGGAAAAHCPRCGFTQADFKKTGRLGCAECYRAFWDGLEGLLKTMHKGIRHAGKVPQTLRRTQDYEERLKALQRKLEKAISDESFEQAAVFRDEIKSLKAELSSAQTT